MVALVTILALCGAAGIGMGVMHLVQKRSGLVSATIPQAGPEAFGTSTPTPATPSVEQSATPAASAVEPSGTAQSLYYKQLRVVRYIEQPFRLLFTAWDGDVKSLDSLQFQINTIDVRQPTQSVKIGDIISGTKFKILKFDENHVNNGNTQDASELTVQNTETGDKVVLIINKISDCPDSYALFQYLWNNTEFRVKKGNEFVLLPEVNLRYRLTDVNEDGALIQTPEGQQVKVPHL